MLKLAHHLLAAVSATAEVHEHHQRRLRHLWIATGLCTWGGGLDGGVPSIDGVFHRLAEVLRNQDVPLQLLLVDLDFSGDPAPLDRVPPWRLRRRLRFVLRRHRHLRFRHRYLSLAPCHYLRTRVPSSPRKRSTRSREEEEGITLEKGSTDRAIGILLFRIHNSFFILTLFLLSCICFIWIKYITRQLRRAREGEELNILYDDFWKLLIALFELNILRRPQPLINKVLFTLPFATYPNDYHRSVWTPHLTLWSCGPHIWLLDVESEIYTAINRWIIIKLGKTKLSL